MRRITAARLLSIAGHPAFLMPCAIAGVASAQHAPASALGTALGVSVLVAVVVAAYSAWQVSSGRWAHIDASRPEERRQLNLLLAVLLFSAAGLLAWRGASGGIVGGLTMGGLIVVFAYLLRGRLKVSLHAAFAVFAACLLTPLAWAALACLGLAAGVGWSRVVLGRHTPAEVIVGLAAGAAAGISLHVITTWHG